MNLFVEGIEKGIQYAKLSQQSKSKPPLEKKLQEKPKPQVEVVSVNDARAQFNKAWAYVNGEGVKQDYKEALKWYQLSAEQGNPNAQNNLGVLYQYGLGVSIDYKEALKWYRISAKQGFAQGQFNLGKMYDFGNGVKRDKQEAIRFYKLAAAQGEENAIKRLKSLGK